LSDVNYLVIIGHGPSLIGQKCAELIDSMPVVRLKNPDWLPKEDYGKRTDIMVSSTEIMNAMSDWPQVPKEYWAQPKKGKWNTEMEAKFRAKAKAPLRIPLDTFLRWNAVFQGLTDRGIPNFSTGMAAIVFAMDFGREVVEFDEIVLAGFDTLCNPDEPYVKAGKGKWATGHDWWAEHRMIPRLIDEYSIPVRRLNAKTKTIEPMSWARERVWECA